MPCLPCLPCHASRASLRGFHWIETRRSAAGQLSELSEYKTLYIDVIAALLQQYRNVPAVAILEPDSLGNLITSDSKGGCNAEVASTYREGVSYAARTLAAHAPHVALYVDAGHGGWLGFEENAARFAALVRDLGIAPLIRGFSTNVANYQPLGDGHICPRDAFAETGTRDTRPGAGEGFRGVAHWCKEAGMGTPCCAYDPCNLLKSYGGGATEMTYAQTLQVRAQALSIP